MGVKAIGQERALAGRERERLGLVALLVGDIGSGKTTICRRLVGLARRRGLRPAGIITQPLYDEQGDKAALVAEDLWARERRLLAMVEQAVEPAYALGAGPATPRPAALRRGPYTFDPAAFAWAERAVRASLRQEPDLAILDEVGPLELERGTGFAPLLPSLLAPRCPTLLVVRRALRPALEARLGGPALLFEVTAAGRDALPEDILGGLWPA